MKDNVHVSLLHLFQIMYLISQHSSLKLKAFDLFNIKLLMPYGASDGASFIDVRI